MGALLTLLGQAARAAGIYYVDNTSAACSNSGPGTEAQPYCTISAAVSARGGPGTTIYVKPGIYREQVNLSVSGASGSPLVIQALGGTVTIDGADDFSGTGKWSAYSGNVYRASSVTWSPVQVIIDVTRLTPSTASPASLPTNSFTYVSGQGLYVNFGGDNPGAHQVNVGHRSYCFSAYTRSYITIDGFQLLHTEDRGVNLGSSCTNVTVTHCNASWNWRYGIFAQGGSGFLFGSNTCSDNQDHGISLISGTTNSTIEDNECARNARLDIREANGIYLYGCPGNVLRRNRTHDNQDTGLHIQTGSNGNLLYLNRSWNNGDHGFDHLLATNNIHIGDVAYGNYKDGFSIEGSATGQQLYNCIAIDNGLTTNEFDLWVDSASTSGFVSDYNIFWNSTSQTPFKYISTQYSTLAAYQAASGKDAHSIQANPRFVNPGAGDFHLLSGSPAIDSGNSGVTNWPALDADGQARVDDPATANTGTGPIAYGDRGSFEYVNVGVPHPPVVTAPGTASGTENVLLTVNITASDPDGDPITSLTASGLPAGATFAAGVGNTSGTLSWTPSAGQGGTYPVTFTASNALSGSATTILKIGVPDRAPTVTAPATYSGSENTPVVVNISASDPDGDPISSLTATGLPSGAIFTPGGNNTTGQLTWTPTYTQAGSYTVTFTAANGLSGSASTVLTIANVDRAPTLATGGTVNGSEGVPLTTAVTATDPDGDAITSLTASGLPTGATFTAAADNKSGTLSWTPDFNQSGSYTVTFTASNALSGSAATTMIIADNDQPPVVTVQATATGPENALLTFSVSASDPDAGDTIASLTAGGLPAGATFTAGAGNTSGTFSWTPSFTQAGSYTVNFTAANARSGSASTAITITNVDRAPQVSAISAISVRPGFPLIFQVTASDVDGESIASLTAALPPGASFTPNGSKTAGTFSWTPTQAQIGDYAVTFTASNAMSGSATTQVTVSLTADQNPVVTAPASQSPRAGTMLTFQVTASDPDGNPINSLVGSPLPGGASFNVGSGNTSGTFSWTPTTQQQGSYSVSFTASNVLIGWATTAITVRPPNQLPIAVLTVTPATGNAPLAVTANAGGSSDPDADGGIASYRFNFGDGTIVGPQAASSAPHSYAAGTWTCTVTVTDVDGGTASASKTVIVAPVGAGANLIANPSFETNTSGWGPQDLATLTRVAGGFDGGFALQVSTSKNQTFGINDNPNSVGSAGSAGTRYRCQAWVRSNNATGDVRLRIREYNGSSLVATSNSSTKTLSPTWQMLTIDYTVAGAGHSLDVSVLDQPHGSNGPWLVDNLSLRVLTGAATEAEVASIPPPPAETEESIAGTSTDDPLALGPPLKVMLAPSPVRSASTLSFRTTAAGALRVALYDTQGRRVRMLLDEPWSEAGVHRVPVDARGDQGPLEPGVYFYRIVALEGASSGRLVIAR